MKRTALGTLLGIVLLAGCGDQVVVGAGATAAPTPGTPAYGNCPSPQPTDAGTWTAIDYMDSLQANGRFYAGDSGLSKLSSHQRGAQQLLVRCNISEWSDQYGQGMTARDGDATFLAVGTPVYAVKGEPAQCQLMAAQEGHWHLYISYGNGCPPEPPVPTGSTSASEPPPLPTPLQGCPTKPPLTANEGHAAVDYKDAVQFQGRLYFAQPTVLHDLDHIVGDVEFTVGCALGPYNDATGRQATMQDGDATFLFHGDRVYAEQGWPARCRLVAKNSDGQWHRYLAQVKDASVATTDPCAHP